MGRWDFKAMNRGLIAQWVRRRALKSRHGKRRGICGKKTRGGRKKKTLERVEIVGGIGLDWLSAARY